MSRIVPHPVLSALLLLLWLLLQGSLGLGHVLFGGALAVLVPILAAPVLPKPPRLKRPWALGRLLLHALTDVGRSNLAVFWVLLHPRPKPTAAFIELKLDLSDPMGLAILACLVTAIPGSAWLEYKREQSTVLIHVFDLVDEAEWVRTVKQRYEAPLLEVFG